MYAAADNEIAVHLYGESKARVPLASGVTVTLAQTTRYPWDGAIHFEINPDRNAEFALSLRIPEWAEGTTLAVNGTPVDLLAVTIDGYARIEREWQAGDKVDLNIPLIPRTLFANPRVRQDAGRAALMRGPLVYCVETTDNGHDLNGISLAGNPASARTAEIAALEGAVALDIPVTRDEADWGSDLYRTTPPKSQAATARFVPYHLWDNREPGEMLVWIRTDQSRGA
jgi:DUF1680 family protein